MSLELCAKIAQGDDLRLYIYGDTILKREDLSLCLPRILTQMRIDMLKLEFVDASNNYTKYKAAIHITGKLGFNIEANEFMGLEARKFFKVAFDRNDSGFTQMFLVDSDESPVAAKVYKAGRYYYLNLANIFNKIKVDYKVNSISFTIEKAAEPYEGKDLFILNKHKSTKRKDNEKEEDGASELNEAE